MNNSPSDRRPRRRLEVAKAARYLPVLSLTGSHDYGVFEVRMDGKPIPRTIDLHSPKLTFVERYLPQTTLAAGEHTITLVNRGRAGASGGHFCGVDHVIRGHQ